MNIDKRYHSEYVEWLTGLKNRIKSTQIKAALSANKEIIELYWEIGRELFEKQDNQGWGNSVVDNLEKDLVSEFPDMKGFSRRNLFYMKGFYTFYKSDFEKVQQLVAQIPWGHNILIVSRSNSMNEALFYLAKTIENNWSRSVLDMQIRTDLYSRQGKAITNFKNTLPLPGSDLATQTLKDPYLFDFLTLKQNADEKSIEDQLTKHITQFLLELGTGFAFIGRQYKIEVGDKDFFIDLLFYHTKLRCYVVVELKAKRFKPEYTGKLSFYLSAIDDKLKTESDNPTIGIILCQEKNKIEAEYALRGISQPIGVAEYQLSRAIPENIKSDLPTIEDIEKELSTTLNGNERG
ncbi:putative nuclease of restriction endonuclease-like (RecB) superfamily [Breznakibacter xylanolyticus]|uniref:Putative nuclease of restriction endonuclease-like (RecB) superfamily n=1 Tax=Breznakibacter xylanolyticus TaxID=990 RepID=A0A2W7N4H0_9BACT|nr:PDDEXK nuclease domain-containing protein [Breznakibacter xylanolyticus]PZX14980.1 putative nuclease of restriction endonuclease-like (RecB) superfamily [Breznakibacter xylanolyticus]